MRLAVFHNPEVHASLPAVVLGDGGRVSLATLFAPVVPAWCGDVMLAIEHLPEIRQAVASYKGHGEESLEKFSRLPPIPQPRTVRDFYAFEKHVANCRTKRGLAMDPAWYAQPAFYFSNPLCLVGNDAPVSPPTQCQELDFELEIALVVGRRGCNIRAADTFKHVAGFTILNDLSARDLQRREMSIGLGPAKAKDFATAVGPDLVTTDELCDHIDKDGRLHLHMSARLNGREISRGNAADMYFSWPQIVEHASRDACLYPGDILGSGTVGTGCILELGPETTGGWLKTGDVVELEIERLGVLRTPIVARLA